MADLTVTASQVIPGVDAVLARGTAGGTITAGHPLYRDSTDGNRLKAARANADATSRCVGIALEGASDGQPVIYQTDGHVTVGAGANPEDGESYYVSDSAAGGIMPVGDFTTGDYVAFLGIANADDQINLRILATGRTRQSAVS